MMLARLRRRPLVFHLLLGVELGVLAVVLDPRERCLGEHMFHHPPIQFPANRPGTLLQDLSQHRGAAFLAVAIAARIGVLQP
ncbi:MAG: hypothetical protein KA771_02855 [Spirochaetales bacterium]|nr:hypothetical protein [Spirochaetales bacterium]